MTEEMNTDRETMEEHKTPDAGADEGTGEELNVQAEGDSEIQETPGAEPEAEGAVSQDLPEEGEEGFTGEGETSETEELDPEGRLQEDLDTLQGEMDRLQDQHLRLAADFENYRKRVNGELAGRWVRAQAELVASLVEGLDDLQRVSQFTSEDATVDTLVEGVDLVERKLLKALTDAGLEVVEPLGEVFDPNTMEAMMRVPVGEEGEEGTVQQVLQKGYLFKDQLVRPARVSVYMDDD